MYQQARKNVQVKIVIYTDRSTSTKSSSFAGINIEVLRVTFIKKKKNTYIHNNNIYCTQSHINHIVLIIVRSNSQ